MADVYQGRGERSCPGDIDAIILYALADGDSYGYGIPKDIATASEGGYEMKEPSLYTSLKRFEGQGHVESYWGNETQCARRKHHRITLDGRKELTAAVERWDRVRAIIDGPLKQDGGDARERCHQLKEERYGNLAARYEDYDASGVSEAEALEKTKASITDVDHVLSGDRPLETVSAPAAATAALSADPAAESGATAPSGATGPQQAVGAPVPPPLASPRVRLLRRVPTKVLPRRSAGSSSRSSSSSHSACSPSVSYSPTRRAMRRRIARSGSTGTRTTATSIRTASTFRVAGTRFPSALTVSA